MTLLYSNIINYVSTALTISVPLVYCRHGWRVTSTVIYLFLCVTYAILYHCRIVLVSKKWYWLAHCGSLRARRLRYVQYKRDKFLQSKVWCQPCGISCLLLISICESMHVCYTFQLPIIQVIKVWTLFSNLAVTSLILTLHRRTWPPNRDTLAEPLAL